MKKAIFSIVILFTLVLFISGCNNSGEKHLKEKYEVLGYYCDIGIVEMKSLGNRQDQVLDSLFSLYQNCKNSEDYSIFILEPTKECIYMFGGEPVNIWYESTEQDNYSISEESKRIIEADFRFSSWIWYAEAFYSLEQQDRLNETYKTDNFISTLISDYKVYLENGITKSTLGSYMLYELNRDTACESLP